MELTEYLRANNLTQQQFAEQSECSPSAISHICTGRRKPSPTKVFRIEKASGNAVTRYDLRPDIYGEMPKRRKATRGKVRLDDLYPAEAEGERA